MITKKKILIPINSDLYIRNYIRTGVWKILADKYKVFFIANKKIKNLDELNSLENFKGFFLYEKKEEIRHQRILNTLMWRFRKKSTSFFYRLKWFSQVFQMGETKVDTIKISLFNLFRVLKLRIFIQFCGSIIIFPLFKKFYMFKTKPNLDLSNLVKNISPDLILVPTQAQCSMDNDLIKICKNNKIKSIFLVDNWDNLSDKSIMWNKPDLIGVWGDQSKKHAIKIQNFESDKVINIGTPRFENYFKERNSILPSYFDFKYILFLGTALEFDEIKIIKIIENFLIKKKLNNIKIVYRPHPWRMAKKKIKLQDFNKVIIDPQVEQQYLKSSSVNPQFQPDINYYSSLIKNSEFVVGGLTSMLIESSICYKHYIVTAFPEKQFNNQFNSLKYMVHFRELNSLDNVMISTNKLELEDHLLKLLDKSQVNIDRDTIDNQRRFFLYDDEKDYSIRLLDLVSKLI